MTAIHDLTRTPPPISGAWEWHENRDDGYAHLYDREQLRGHDSDRVVLVRPWCETSQQWPLDHHRASVSRRKVIPTPGRACPCCARQNEHRRVEIHHAR